MRSRCGFHDWLFICRLQFCKQRRLSRTDAHTLRQLARTRTLNDDLACAVLQRQSKGARVSGSTLYNDRVTELRRVDRRLQAVFRPDADNAVAAFPAF